MIAIIGASGFVGSHLLYRLVMQGKTVRAIVRNKQTAAQKIELVFGFYGATTRDFSSQIVFIEADVLDPESLVEAFTGVSNLYHCAGYVSFNPSEQALLHQTNVLGTHNCVNAALTAKVARLCFLSSIAALGDTHSDLQIDELTYWKPDDKHSLYAKAKYEAEQEVWRGMAEGLPAVVCNAGVIVGPGAWGDSSTALFTAVDKGMKYYTNGVSGYVDVRDVAEVMIRLMNESSISEQQYITVSQNLSVKQVFEAIADGLEKPKPTREAQYWQLRLLAAAEKVRYWLTGKSPRITRSSARTAVTQSYYDNKKLIELLKISFIPIAESIQFTCNCYKQRQ